MPKLPVLTRTGDLKILQLSNHNKILFVFFTFFAVMGLMMSIFATVGTIRAPQYKNFWTVDEAILIKWEKGWGGPVMITWFAEYLFTDTCIFIAMFVILWRMKKSAGEV